MKPGKLIVLTALLTLGSFAALVSVSCIKSKCSGVSCANGGSCSGGTCFCPTGYSGQHCELTSIVYQNNTPSYVALNVNGAIDTIPRGASGRFFGTPGVAATGTASTRGLYGNVVSWTISDVFPAAGSSYTNQLNVSTDYFFLEVINIDAYPINYLLTNPGTSTQTVEPVSIGADRYSYGIGYYKNLGTNVLTVDFAGGTGASATDTVSIPQAQNAVYVLTVM